MFPEKRTKQLRRSLHGALGQAASGYTQRFLKPPGGSEHAQQPGTGLGFLPTAGHVHVLGQYSLSKWITEDPQRIMPTLLGCTASQRDLSTSTHKLSVAMLFHGIYFHTLGVGDLVYHHPGSLCAA